MVQKKLNRMAPLLILLLVLSGFLFAEGQGEVQTGSTWIGSPSSGSLTQITKPVEGDGSRVALIIGNSSYRYMNTLPNPKNDAEDMSQLLKKVGFETELLLDGSLSDIEGAARSFLDKARKNEVGTSLFFYAGHAVQYEGSNYLLPIDADIKRDNELLGKAYNMDVLLKGLERSSADLNLIILDACRDNPFSTTRGGTRGLSAMGFGTAESMVVFATAPGSVAEDGTGRNSPFTSAMKEHLTTPDLEVRQFIAQVSKSVQEQTKGRQIPWVNTSFTGQFFFLTGEQELLLRQGQLATLSSELAQLDAEYLAMQEEIANAINDDDRGKLELEQKRIAALTTAKRLEAERIQRLQTEAEQRLTAQQEELKAKQLLQSKLSEEGRLLEQLAQKRRIELDNLARQRVSSTGAMLKLKTIAQYEQTIIDVGDSYDETIRLSNIEFANLKKNQIDSYVKSDPQDPWETSKEFQDRIDFFEAILIADADRQIAEIERQRNQDVTHLREEMEAYKREASNAIYTIGYESTNTQVNVFNAEQKSFPLVVNSRDADFPFSVTLDYVITTIDRKAIGEEYSQIDTAAKANALMSKLYYSINELYPKIWVVSLERYELFNILEESEQTLSPILALDKADLQIREFVFQMEAGRPKPCYAVTQFDSDMGDAIVYRNGIEISQSGAVYIVNNGGMTSFTATFRYKNGIKFETEVQLKQGINEPVIPNRLVLFDSMIKYDGHAMVDRNNRDGKLNPGETVRLDMRVKNTSSSKVLDLKAKMSSESPYVKWVKDEFTYGDLAAGKTNTGLGINYYRHSSYEGMNANYPVMELTVSSSAPVGTVIPIKIDFTNTQGRSWQDAFTLMVER